MKYHCFQMAQKKNKQTETTFYQFMKVNEEYKATYYDVGYCTQATFLYSRFGTQQTMFLLSQLAPVRL